MDKRGNALPFATPEKRRRIRQGTTNAENGAGTGESNCVRGCPQKLVETCPFFVGFIRAVFALDGTRVQDRCPAPRGEALDPGSGFPRSRETAPL